MDFLAEQHQCGQHLLKLVARGNSIIAELLRLKDVIPSVYRSPSRVESQRFGELITLDFNYFKQGNSDFEERYERKVESNDELAAADEELKDTFTSLLKRFYRLFENIYNYVRDLNYFLKSVEDGEFIQMNSLEAIFLDEDGKQLLCESLYVYGVMLILVDLYIEGPVRERLLVGHYRYSGAEANIADICKLLRSTGFSPTGKRPQNYPESYFSRIPIQNRFVRLVIARLRSDDIYNQLRTYQNPDHRCTALAEQASMLYVALNFEPSILSNETATMREIVDKFFSNNWVISYYMGTTVNLIEVWEPYKAAKAALANILQTSNIKQISQKYRQSLKEYYPSVSKGQKEGALTEEKVLDHAVKMMNIVQECNVTLKWMMLHTTPLSPSGEINKKCRQFRDLVISEIGYEQGNDVFALLLNTSQFEFRLRTILKKLLENRETKWETAKEETRIRLRELSEIYGNSHNDSISGNPSSSNLPTSSSRRLVKSDHLEKWFLDREKQLEELTLSDIGFSTGVAAQLIEALSEAEDLDQLDASWQVKQLISESKGFLKQMIRIGGAKENLLITLQIIGDISYAWGDIIDNFTPHMQQGVKKDPSLVSKLRATFLKLSSAMERPVLRISQARSNDMVSVAQYFSAELVAYVRKVLQIIPESLFKVLDQIISLQTDRIEELPTRLIKDKLRDMAQLNERFEVARLTHSISVFTEGMLSMKSTSVGVIKVDPKQLLEDGIRKEIVRQVTWALHNGLMFNTRAKSSELMSKLTQLNNVMSGYQRSFEYISDYVGIAGLGLKIWHSELARIFKFIVEQESNPLVRNKVLPSESTYQSRAVPIPLHTMSTASGGGGGSIQSGPNSFAITFIGRLANEIVALTNPRNTIFVHARQAWYDSRTTEEVVSVSKLFPLLETAVGLNGLAGLDKLYGLRIKSVCLQREFLHAADITIFRDKNWIDMLENLADSLNNGFVMAAPYKFYYQQHVSRAAKPLANLSEAIVNIGHLQLLRKSIAYQLSSSSKFDAKLLYSALSTLDRSIASELKFRLTDPEGIAGNLNDGKFLSQLNNYLSSSGITEPEKQIYVEAKPGPRLAELIFLIILSTLSKLVYSPNAGGLIAKRSTDMLDGYPFFLGISCLLRQYPTAIMDTVIEYVAQYIRSFVKEQSSTNKVSELPPDVTNAVVCLEVIMQSHEETRDHIEKLLPKPLFDFKTLPSN